MQKLSLTFAIILICGVFAYAGPEALPSSGKDMKQTIAPVPECDFSWTGFYIGAKGGYGWNADSNVDIHPLPDGVFTAAGPQSLNPDPEGFFGGGELGFNWQVGKWFVIGAEADFSGSDISDGATRVPALGPPGFTPVPDSVLHVQQDVDWFGTVRGRVGFVPWCRMLIYGTGGFAYGDVDFSGDLDFRASPGGTHHYPVSNQDTQTGWTAGGGLEYAINRHWTIKVEYLYVDLGNESKDVQGVAFNPPFHVRYDWDTQFHTVAGGVNFKF